MYTYTYMCLYMLPPPPSGIRAPSVCAGFVSCVAGTENEASEIPSVFFSTARIQQYDNGILSSRTLLVPSNRGIWPQIVGIQGVIEGRWRV